MVDALLLVRSLISSEDSELAPDDQRYLLMLVARLEEAMDQIAVHGVMDVRASADQLVGALTRLYLGDESESGKAAKNTVLRVLSAIYAFLNTPIVAALVSGVTSSLPMILGG